MSLARVFGCSAAAISATTSRCVRHEPGGMAVDGKGDGRGRGARVWMGHGKRLCSRHLALEHELALLLRQVLALQHELVLLQREAGVCSADTRPEDVRSRATR